MSATCLRHLSLACTLALLLTACGGSEAAEAKPEPQQPHANGTEVARQIAELQLELSRLRPRAAAYRHLEFLGDAPALDGSRTTFEVLTSSSAPAAASSDYPDCLVVSRCARLDAPDQPPTAEILVVTVAFHDRKPTAVFRLTAGTRHSAILMPWEQMPESVRSIQRVDETDSFDLPMFAAIGIQPESVRQRVRPPLDNGEAITQEQAIAASIKHIETLEQRHGSFAVWQEELAGLRNDLQARLDAADGPLVDGTRIAIRNLHYITHEPNEQWPEPQIAYFVNLRDQLAARGIDLIVVPFPEQEQLATLLMAKDPPADGVTHPYRLSWHLSLLRAGIEVVDILPALITAADTFENVYYDATDGHPADGGIVTAAAEIARRLRRYRALPRTHPELLVEQRRYGIPDRYPKFPPRARAADCYLATTVLQPDGEALPQQYANGPVLVLGDSFVAVPNGFGVRGADIPSHLVKETGVAVRRRSIGGSAAQLMVHLAKEGPELLDGVRVLIYLFREDYMFEHRPDDAKYRWQVAELPASPR